MRLVYISSPLRGDVERNIQRARDYCAYAASCGVIPLAPHTIFTQYLDDEQPEQREQGLRMGRDLMWRCDDLWVVGSTISSGMREEIELAKKLYMPIFYVPEDMVQEKVKIRQQDHLLRLDDCIEGSSKSSYEGQILVLKPEAYGSSMDLTADDSLWYARDGFGCIYGARGQAVYAENLLDGRYIHRERKDFYGIVKPESLAAWLSDKPIRSEVAEAVLEAAVQDLALSWRARRRWNINWTEFGEEGEILRLHYFVTLIKYLLDIGTFQCIVSNTWSHWQGMSGEVSYV